jgi:hypothetical protein
VPSNLAYSAGEPFVTMVPRLPTQWWSDGWPQSPNRQPSTVLELKSQLPHVGTLAPQAKVVDASHVHWLLLQAPVVPAYVPQLKQLGPQWVPSVFE